MSEEDRRVVACNYGEAVSAVTSGSLAYVTQANPGWGHERIAVLVRSRSGRWIEKWEAISRLMNFRLKTVPPEHPLYGRLGSVPGEADLEALRSAQTAFVPNA